MEEEQNKKKYELSFLVDGEEDAREVLKIINGRGAETILEGQLKKLDLAYPIKKRASAYFGFFHFQCESNILTEIKEELRMSGKIIRSLLVTPPILPRTASFAGYSSRPTTGERQTEKQKEAVEISKKHDLSVGGRSLDATRGRQAIVSNEELEEKLEEILK